MRDVRERGLQAYAHRQNVHVHGLFVCSTVSGWVAVLLSLEQILPVLHAYIGAAHASRVGVSVPGEPNLSRGLVINRPRWRK